MNVLVQTFEEARWIRQQLFTQGRTHTSPVNLPAFDLKLFYLFSDGSVSIAFVCVASKAL